jgi:RNA polymerase sigma factor (sigma-70 family)
MDCEKITQPAIAGEIMQDPEKKHLQENLFHCIYALFQGSFLNWIMNKYGEGQRKQKLWEDAKDAFQNGVSAFYLKAQKEEFKMTASLKTIIFSFGLLQLLAYFKKDKLVYGISDYTKMIELFFEDGIGETENQFKLNQRELSLIDALSTLPEKQRNILLMKFFHKLRSKDIAEVMHVSAGNVDNESTKAYKKLRNILKTTFDIEKEKVWN